ncbi:MAG: tetratricopeptide repeat protein [Gammaproteobacteria bacterium]|nr:tetratricopeptide repeat protein [Gammaproteobacteria bacterium]
MLKLSTSDLRRYASCAFALLFGVLQACTTTGPEGMPPAGVQVQARSETISSWLPGPSEPGARSPTVTRRDLVAFEDALTAIREGRAQAAEVLLRQITAEQPGLAGPWVNLGQVYVSQERYEDARLAFKNAIVANPRSCHAYNQLGVLARQLGDFRGAEELYQACLKQMPEFKDAYLNLGILYELYLGRLPEALAAYRRYQSLSSEPDRKVLGWVMDLERRLGV